MAYTEAAVRTYVENRFPRASKEECERTIRDWLEKPVTAQGIARDFERRARALNGLTVLDVGSGSGGISIALSKFGAKVTGIEIEEELVAIAREEAKTEGSSAEFILYEGTVMPFPNDSFDAAISVSVIEHVDDPVKYFSEILRVLKSDGVLYLAFPNRLYLEETHTGLWGLSYLPRPIAQWYLRLMHARPLEDHGLHFYSYWAMKKIISASHTERKRWSIRSEKGSSTSFLKRLCKATLLFFGVPHQALLPHVMLILEPSEK